MYPLRAFGLMVLFIGLAQLSAAEPNYLPTKLGTRWTYRVQGQDDLIYVLAAKEEKLGEQICTRMDLKIDLITAMSDQVGMITSGAFIPVGRSRFVTISSEYIAPLKDGVYRFKVDENMIGPPVNFLKFGVVARDRWANEFKIKDKNGKVTYTADFEDIEVPAGTYKNTLLITGVTIENGVITRMRNWYAPDVGMVKQVIASGKDETLLELIKMEYVDLNAKK